MDTFERLTKEWEISIGERGATKQQQDALEKLRALQTQGFARRTKHGNIATGINTAILHNLRRAGYIECRNIYLRGICSADLTIK